MRIGLIGYYNYGNYGDELFLGILNRAIPDAFFEVLDQNRLLTDDAYRNLFRANIDLTIIGGGDLIIPYGWAEWYFQPILREKPIVVFGVGVPTWGGQNDEAVRKMRDFFAHSNVKFFSTRDTRSTRWVEGNLEIPVRVQTFSDMVFALDLPEIDKSVKPIFTFITRDQRPGEIAWRNLENLAERAVAFGYQVRNLILGTGLTAEQDRKILAAEAEHMNWEVVGANDNETLTRLIGESSVVASMKFHGSVVATMFGIPAIGLSTTDKFTSLYHDIERSDLIAHHTHSDLAERLPKYLARIPSCSVSRLRASAKNGLMALRQSVMLLRGNV